MRIFYTVGPAGAPTVVAVEPVAPCCGDMDSAWGKFIGFGDKDDYGENHCNQNAEVNFYRFWCRCSDGEVVATSVPITFCPFCGDKIETVEVTPEAP